MEASWGGNTKRLIITHEGTAQYLHSSQQAHQRKVFLSIETRSQSEYGRGFRRPGRRMCAHALDG
jgi:hypothetical protein